MALIEDRRLRRGIVDYYESGQPQMQNQDERVWGVYSDMRPIFHQHFGWQFPDSATSFVPGTPFGSLRIGTPLEPIHGPLWCSVVWPPTQSFRQQA